MEATASSLLRPLARRCLSASSSTSSTTVAAAAVATATATSRSTQQHQQQQIRHKATFSRTKRALNIPPHPSFLAADAASEQDTIIFNPPSAAPSVYHTPFKFLPKTDPRRRANLASLFESHFGGRAAAAQAVSTSDLPVIAEHKHTDRGPITREEVEEMRALRASDPHTWTVRNLGVKFDLPMGFIMACCQAPREKIEFERRKMELIRQRWGPAKRKAMEDRARRRQMLYAGEI